MTIDNYTKFLLTMIAVGIIGINFYLFKGSIVKNANAVSVLEIEGLESQVRKIVETKCQVKGTSRRLICNKK